MSALDALIRLASTPFLRPLIHVADAAVREFESQRFRLLPPTFAKREQSVRDPGRHLAMVTGYFSNDEGRATFGDTEAMRVVTTWLDEMGIPYDIGGTVGSGIHGVDLEKVNTAPYSIFIFVCGPWLDSNNRLLDRFRHAFKIGVNLSIEAGVSHQFDLLLARDLPTSQSPDLVFAATREPKPLAGIILAHRQFEYGSRQRHDHVHEVLSAYLQRREVVPQPLDTTHLYNVAALTTAEQFDTIISRLDVVITTRLHGMVFALKNGIPVVAIDAIAGGAKVTKQAKALDWPLVLDGECITEAEIADGVARCLAGDLDDRVAAARQRAQAATQSARETFVNFVGRLPLNRP